MSPILWMRPVYNKIRSEVVVLPASIWATTPKFRVYVSRSIASGLSCCVSVAMSPQSAISNRQPAYGMSSLADCFSPLPSVVGKRTVRLRHFVRFFPFLHGGAFALVGGQQLIPQALDHGRAFARDRGVANPSQRQRQAALMAHLNRNLVRGPADPPGLELHMRPDVLHGFMEHRQDVVRVGRLPKLVKGPIDDSLRDRFLAVHHDHVDQLLDQAVVVPRIRRCFTPLHAAASSHRFASPESTDHAPQ